MTIEPIFYLEPYVKGYLQALYWATLSSPDNAHRIAKCDKIPSTKEIGGNDLAQSCYKTVVDWLSTAEYFCVEELYNKQILEPAKIAARFRINTRYTVDISGLVLSKSDPFYDKYYQDYVVSVTLVVPELKTAMCLRCRESNLPDFFQGIYTFSSVQPFPLVNRIHPHFLSIKQSKQTIRFSELDFLKTNLRDLKEFGRASPAFENFCETPSQQKKGRRLASICLCSGILTLDFPYIILTHEKHSEKILLSPQITNLEKLETMQRKPVRTIVAVWYGIKQDEYPEALLIEPADSTDEITVDNIIGYVRLRSVVKKEDLLHNFGSIPYHPTLKEKDGSIEFSYGKTRGEFAEKFVQTKKEISSLRFLCNATLLPSFCDLIDKEKLSARCLAKKLRQDTPLLSFLFSLIERYDRWGPLKMREKIGSCLVASDIGDIIKKHKKEYKWLTKAGIISLVGGKEEEEEEGQADVELIQISDIAMRCLYEAMKKEVLEKVWNFFSTHREDVVTLPQITMATNLPAYLVLNALKDLSNRLRPYDNNGLVWIVRDNENAQTGMNAAKLLEDLSSKVLNYLRVPYPIGTTKVVGDLGINYYIAKIILETLEAMDKINKKITPDGEFWFYKLDARILDLLSSNPQNTFTMEEIMRHIQANKEKTSKSLEELKTKGSVEENPKGRWAITTQDAWIRLGRITKAIFKEKSLNLKILDLLSSNPQNTFTMEEIMRHIQANKEKTSKSLEELKTKGSVEENPKGRWAITTQDAWIRRERIKKICIERIKQIRKIYPMQSKDWLREQAISLLHQEYLKARLNSTNIREDAEYILKKALE